MRRHNSVGDPPRYYPHGQPPGRNPGELGQQVVYDLPATSVATLDEILDAVLIPAVGLSAIRFAWGAGDANAPRIWLGAYNALDRLTLTGAPTAVSTPWQDSGGTAIAAERYTTGQRRLTALGDLDTPSGADIYSLVIAKMPVTASTGAGVIWGNSNGGRGFFFYHNGAAVLRFVVVGNTTPVPQPNLAIPNGSLVVAHGLYAPGGNTGLYAGTASSVSASPAGDLAPSILPCGISQAAYPLENSDIVAIVHCHGNGIAAAITAAVRERIDRLVSGVGSRQGAAPVFTRASATAGGDRNGRHHFYSAGLARAGDSEGFAFEPAVTNYVFNTAHIAATAGWTATGGAVLTANVDDSAAQLAGAEGDVSVWGRVLELVNATGNPQHLYSSGPIGVNTACHLMALGRIVAGAGVRLGWRDASTGVYTDVGALVDGYGTTRLQNTSPPDTDCALCFEVPNGATLRVVGMHAGRRANAPRWPVPNWATAAAAARSADALLLPEAALVDGQGAFLADVAALTTPGVTGDLIVARRATSGTRPLYIARDAAGQNTASSNDGTSVVACAAVAGVVDAHVEHRTSWDTGRRWVRDAAGPTAGGYDGAWGAGAVEVGSGGGLPMRVRAIRLLRRPMP